MLSKVTEEIESYLKIIMITEDENILNIVKILRTRIEDKKDNTELILLHQAKNKDNLIIADELKFWEDNELMRVTICMESTIQEENEEEEQQEKMTFLEGRFTDEFLFNGLPLPTRQHEEVVLVSVADNDDYKNLEQRLMALGFADVMRM